MKNRVPSMASFAGLGVIACLALIAASFTWGIWEHAIRAYDALNRAQSVVDTCVDRCDREHGQVEVILLSTGECACGGFEKHETQ